jgi:hypothetical protein
MNPKIRMALLTAAATLAGLGLTNAHSVRADAAPSPLLAGGPVFVSTSIAPGATQTWTWTAHSGTYLAAARLNYGLTARGAAGNTGSTGTPASVRCRLYADGNSGADMFEDTAFALATGIQGLYEDNIYTRTVTLVTAVSTYSGDIHVSLECVNTSTSANAWPASVSQVSLVLGPASALSWLPQPTAHVTAPAVAAAPQPPPALTGTVVKVAPKK